MEGALFALPYGFSAAYIELNECGEELSEEINEDSELEDIPENCDVSDRLLTAMDHLLQLNCTKSDLDRIHQLHVAVEKEGLICGDLLDRLLQLEALTNAQRNRSQSLEQNGIHSPSSSRSSSSNSYVNSIINGVGGAGNHTESSRACLRKCTQPMFRISGDLTPQQIQTVKRTWKQANQLIYPVLGKLDHRFISAPVTSRTSEQVFFVVMKSVDEEEQEIAVRLLLRIFQLDPRNQAYFMLAGVAFNDLRHNPLFMQHVKAFSPTLTQIMSHPTNATESSKYLQTLGGRHVLTGVTYKSAYWKTFVQALIDIVGPDTAEVFEAYTVLIGYKIEYMLQREAERLSRQQEK